MSRVKSFLALKVDFTKGQAEKLIPTPPSPYTLSIFLITCQRFLVRSRATSISSVCCLSTARALKADSSSTAPHKPDSFPVSASRTSPARSCQSIAFTSGFDLITAQFTFDQGLILCRQTLESQPHAPA